MDLSSRNLVIAIDGPAGAGKSTVAKRLARELGLGYLDSGAMYRCVGLLALRRGVDPTDANGCARIAEAISIQFEEGDPQRVILDGEDVTAQIRTPEVGEAASALSVHPKVRSALVRKQRQMISSGGWVLEGRDATTVIAPDADVKVFLTADLRTRAARRLKEFQERHPEVTLEEVERQIAERDHRDSTRSESPLTVCEGATVVDTSEMRIEDVIQTLRSLAMAASKS